MHRRSPLLSSTPGGASSSKKSTLSPVKHVAGNDTDITSTSTNQMNSSCAMPALSPTNNRINASSNNPITSNSINKKIYRKKNIRRKNVKSTAFKTFYGGTIREDCCTKAIIIGGIVTLLVLFVSGSILIQQISPKKTTTSLEMRTTNSEVHESDIEVDLDEHDALATINLDKAQKNTLNKINDFVKNKGNKEEKKHVHSGIPKTQPMTPSSLYDIPDAMDGIGDKTDEYALLRKEYDEAYPVDPVRSMQVVEQLQRESTTGHLKTRLRALKEKRENPDLYLYYDIYNCPPTPPKGYPHEWHTEKVLQHWPPNQVEPPEDGTLYQSVCVFDYYRDYEKAMTYRSLEVPFVIRNDPNVAQSTERWNSPNYMKRLLGSEVRHRVEYSTSNHFLYYVPLYGLPDKKWVGKLRGYKNQPGRGRPEGWEQPTKPLFMPYTEWLDHANVTDPELLGPDKPHWYLRLIGCGLLGPRGDCDFGSSEYLYDELTFFQPRLDDTNNIYLVDPSAQGGIHCRFGMQGVIAENHYDAARNAIVVLGGERRYILSHPKQCSRLALYPPGHPSSRHSAIDWSLVGENNMKYNNSESTYAWKDQFPEFVHARSNELVLRAGDVLYLPTHWFHFIVSLNLNFQCNTRSGKSPRYQRVVKDCGF